jgi:hypothetical protein
MAAGLSRDIPPQSTNPRKLNGYYRKRNASKEQVAKMLQQLWD